MTAPRRALPAAPSRRGWCPSLARPMPTGDGLLARIHPPLGRLTPAQARAVAAGARRFGNGHIDVTARANLQVRGVTDATRCGLADALTASALGDVRHDGGPQRLTLTTPLAGLEPAQAAEITGLATAIEGVGAGIPGLPPKTLVAVEDGARGVRLGTAEADLHLVADAEGLALHLSGEAAWRRVPGPEAMRVVAAALRGLAESGQRRMRDLAGGDRARLVERFAPHPAPAEADRLRPGVIPLADGRCALLVEAPFGRCTAESLETLAEAAEALGQDGLCLSPTRGFLLVAPDLVAAESTRDTLAAGGFLTRADDPRGAVAACPGAPACASGSTPTLHDAARLATLFRPFAARGLRAHVSGCAKGCAHPAVADLTLVGRDGQYDVVLGGRSDALPAMRLSFEAALDRVRRADSERPLDHAFGDHAAPERSPSHPSSHPPSYLPGPEPS